MKERAARSQAGIEKAPPPAPPEIIDTLIA